MAVCTNRDVVARVVIVFVSVFVVNVKLTRVNRDEPAYFTIVFLMATVG